MNVTQSVAQKITPLLYQVGFVIAADMMPIKRTTQPLDLKTIYPQNEKLSQYANTN
jgi:hypothetical protein